MAATVALTNSGTRPRWARSASLATTGRDKIVKVEVATTVTRRGDGFDEAEPRACPADNRRPSARGSPPPCSPIPSSFTTTTSALDQALAGERGGVHRRAGVEVSASACPTTGTCRVSRDHGVGAADLRRGQDGDHRLAGQPATSACCPTWSRSPVDRRRVPARGLRWQGRVHGADQRGSRPPPRDLQRQPVGDGRGQGHLGRCLLSRGHRRRDRPQRCARRRLCRHHRRGRTAGAHREARGQGLRHVEPAAGTQLP